MLLFGTEVLTLSQLTPWGSLFNKRERVLTVPTGLTGNR